MPINGFLYPGASGPPSPYEVANSLRFDDGSSDRLNITPSSTGNRKNWTWSSWIKRSGAFGSKITIFGSFEDTNFNNYIHLFFTDADKIELQNVSSGSNTGAFTTDRVFRDPSAWLHLLLEVDTTESTASDRIKLYINGQRETNLSSTANPSLNEDLQINISGRSFEIGAFNSNQYFDGYMAEVVLLDGTSADTSSFGEFDSDSPTIWKPINVSGLTFGTNGFHLDFEDSSALGNDVSGNDNDFSVNNLTAIDQSTDTCTNNFCTLNPLDNYYFNSAFSEGNLKVVTNSGNYSLNTSTFWLSAGKWYWEVKVGTSSTNDMIGIAHTQSTSTSNYLGHNANGYAYRGDGAIFYNYAGTTSALSGFGSGTLGTYGNGDIIMFALDLTNSKLYCGVNGTWGNSGDPTSGSTGTGAVSITAVGSTPNGVYTPAISDWHNAASLTAEINFGSPSFAISSGNADGNGYGNFEYAPPSGFLSLCTKNLGSDGG